MSNGFTKKEWQELETRFRGLPPVPLRITTNTKRVPTQVQQIINVAQLAHQAFLHALNPETYVNPYSPDLNAPHPRFEHALTRAAQEARYK